MNIASFFHGFVADISRIRGVNDPIEINVNGSLSANVALFVLDGTLVPSVGICDRFRYRLNPLLVDRIDEAGEVCFRPLLDTSFRGLTDEILYLDLIQTHQDFHGYGVGSSFYRQLQSLASTFGYRFLAHRHINRKASDFFLKRGCYSLEDIKPEFRPHFEIIENEDPSAYGWKAFYGISFLDPSDIVRFVLPGKVRK